MAKSRHKARPDRFQRVRIGHREVETLGLTPGFWTDLYHRAMTVSWPAFFATAALIFIALNALFAVLYSLGNRPIANVAGQGILDLFYFSIETLATVGYGDMHPQTNYGHFVATVEIFTGMSFLAVMTGLIFARFSRPRARFVFADHPVVTCTRASHPDDPPGQCTAQRHLQGDCAAVAHPRRKQQGRRSVPPLLRAEGRTRRASDVRVSWTLFHTIDKDSILHGATAAELEDADALLVVNVDGLDDSSAQQLYARRIYAPHDIRWRHRYRNITSVSPEGRFQLDYTKFHDVVPED